MKSYSMLIVDDHLEWCCRLQEEFLQHPDFIVAPSLHNGQEAIAYLEEYKPDVIILDLVMPIYDGMYVIHYIREQMTGYCPFIYVLSAIDTQKTNRVMRSLDVNYYSVKPISAKVVVTNLRILLAVEEPVDVEPFILLESAQQVNYTVLPSEDSEASAPDLLSIIEDFLYKLGAPLYRLSTRCTIAAIRLCLDDESNLESITTLYERTALLNDPPVTPCSIERNIRSTVAKMQKNTTAWFLQCFPYGTDKLTNTEFLHGCVYMLRRRLEDSPGNTVLLRKNSG